jgi:hypothetical protein
MEINLTDQTKMILQIFLLIILPWIAIILGMILSIENIWYYLLSITWFGSGVVFMGVFN